MKCYTVVPTFDRNIKVIENEKGLWVDAEIAQNLYDNLSDAVDILEGIMEDPEVINVFKWHYDHQDIHEMKKALVKADKGVLK